jgi:hypothetical protein
LDFANLTVSVGPLRALAHIGRLRVSLSGGLNTVNGQGGSLCTAIGCAPPAVLIWNREVAAKGGFLVAAFDTGEHLLVREVLEGSVPRPEMA